MSTRIFCDIAEISQVKKFNKKILEEEYSTQIIIFDFLTLFGIVLFSFVILFPFYMMVVTSFKTQIALLVNPLDFSINFAQGFKDLFKSICLNFRTLTLKYSLLFYSFTISSCLVVIRYHTMRF